MKVGIHILKKFGVQNVCILECLYDITLSALNGLRDAFDDLFIDNAFYARGPKLIGEGG